MTRMGSPQLGLTALLDALERELLAAQAGEVLDALRECGRARNIVCREICQEIRALLNEAIVASEESSPATLPPDTCAVLDRLSGVSRELRAAPRDGSHANAFPGWSSRRH